MKNKPILRWLILGLIHLLMYILAVPLFLFYYPLRNTIVTKSRYSPLYWFMNDSEPDAISNVYGAKWWRDSKGFDYDKSNFLVKMYYAFLWMAIRNSHWNFRKYVTFPKQGKMTDLKIIKFEGDSGATTFRNYTIWGIQYITYKIQEIKYFRYSFTKPTPKLIRWFLRDTWNIQLGWASDRAIFKSRFFNKKRKKRKV